MAAKMVIRDVARCFSKNDTKWNSYNNKESIGTK
jgi:hypothetical protein